MLVAGKSPIPKTMTSQQGTARSRVGLTSASHTPAPATRPIVTIKSPDNTAASPGGHSGTNATATTTATTTNNNNNTNNDAPAIHRRPLLTPQQTHSSRILSTARAAATSQKQQQQQHSSSTAGVTARSGSATARSGSATARSTSASKQHVDPTTTTSSSSTQPFHRPALSNLHPTKTVPVSRMTDAKTSSRQGSVNNSNNNNNNIGGAAGGSRSNSISNQRSSSATSTSSQQQQPPKQEGGTTSGPGGRRGSALGGNARTPSPVSIKTKRCKNCAALVSDLDKHAAECPCAPTECRLNDSEDPKLMCGFIARGDKHLAEHQQSGCQFRLVECRNADAGCTDLVSVSSMDRHMLQTCRFSVVLCEFCKRPVTRGRHEAHVSTECACVKVLCPLGCGRDILRSELTEHILAQWSDPAHPRRLSGPNEESNNNSNSNKNNNNVSSSSSSSSSLPPESARRVAETLLTCLEVVSQQKETETILAPSDEIDLHPIGGDANSFEHALFVGQCVLRSIGRLEKYVTMSGKTASSFSSQLAQSVFELVERRCEAAKQRLKPFCNEENNNNNNSNKSEIAASLKNNLETSLGRVALEVCAEE